MARIITIVRKGQVKELNIRKYINIIPKFMMGNLINIT